MVFMSGVLQMYVKLFDHMLATAPTPTPDAVVGSGAQEVDGPMVKQQLQYLRDTVQKLQKHRYKEQKDFLKNLTKLEHVKVPADRKLQKLFLKVFKLARSPKKNPSGLIELRFLSRWCRRSSSC